MEKNPYNRSTKQLNAPPFGNLLKKSHLDGTSHPQNWHLSKLTYLIPAADVTQTNVHVHTYAAYT